MLNVYYLLLMIGVGRCTEDLNFETKTVAVGDDVTLTCNRPTSEPKATLFWIRLLSVDLPELLGGTLAIDFDGVNKTPRITAKQEPGTFVLHISETQLNDTGAYYCVKVDLLDMTLLKGTFLRIKGPEPDVTTITEVPPSDPVRPGDSVTLQCSVLSDPEKKTCPGEHSVYWFTAGSDQSHPSLIYPHRNSGDGCERSGENHSPQKCVYTFSKTASASDAETQYCAVAACGEILFGNGTRLNIEAHDMWDLQKLNTVVFLLCAALSLSLIVITFLIYTIKKKSCSCHKAAVAQHANAAAANADQQNQKRCEDSLVYSAPAFTKKKAGKAERRNVKIVEKETTYSDIRLM